MNFYIFGFNVAGLIISATRFLQGKKTYFVAAGAILTAIGGYLDHKLTGGQFITATFLALTSSTLKAGQNRLEQNLTTKRKKKASHGNATHSRESLEEKQKGRKRLRNG